MNKCMSWMISDAARSLFTWYNQQTPQCKKSFHSTVCKDRDINCFSITEFSSSVKWMTSNSYDFLFFFKLLIDHLVETKGKPAWQILHERNLWALTLTCKGTDSCSTCWTLASLPPTRTGLKRMNSVSLLAKYKDMLCKVLGSLLFITR